MSNQSILYSVLVSPVFCGCQKRKKKQKQYVQVRTTELHEQRGSLSSLFPLPCNLDQASRGWEDDILSGLWRQLRQQRAFYARAKNTQGTKGSNFPILDCKALQGFNALTTAEENQSCFSCRQRADESLFFFDDSYVIKHFFVLTVRDAFTFVWFVVGVAQSLVVLLPRSKIIRQPFAPVRLLWPAVAMGPVWTMMVFGNSQHDQHGKQHHQQTHNLHGGRVWTTQVPAGVRITTARTC